MTASARLAQTANNTAVMSDLRQDQRGVVSGLLNLSRNLGLITGASVMGAIFSGVMEGANLTSGRQAAVATGMQITFAAATALVLVALGIGRKSYGRTRSGSDPRTS